MCLRWKVGEHMLFWAFCTSMVFCKIANERKKRHSSLLKCVSLQQDKWQPSVACHSFTTRHPIQFPLIWGIATLRMETIICQAKCESFIIPLYWPVNYKSSAWAGAFVKLVALYFHLYLAAIRLGLLLSLPLKHVSQFFPTPGCGERMRHWRCFAEM